MADSCPKSIAEAREEYKQYTELKRKDDYQDMNQDAGTPAYLVSVKWVKQYKKFILYEQFLYQIDEDKFHLKDDHWTKMHPGPITNTEFLEDDDDKVNLYGTGTDKDMSKEYIDQYVD